MSTENQTEMGLAQHAIPATDTFDLVLDQLYRGDAAVVTPCKCTFSYTWDFSTNMGMAEIQTLDDAQVHVPLNPIGIQGYLDFMSSQGPVTVTVDGKQVEIRLVVLHINLETGERTAAIDFNTENGSVVQMSQGFDRPRVTGL